MNALQQIDARTRRRIASGLDAKRHQLVQAWERRRRLFVPTERNPPCARLFAELGCEGRFRLSLKGELPEVPDWLTVSAL